MPPYAIVSGAGGGTNSHKITKGFRFSDEIIADLLESKWWEYDLPLLMQMLQNNQQPLPLDSPKDFLSFMRNSDTSLWPRIPDNWLYIKVINSEDIEVNACSPDMVMPYKFQRA